MLGMYGATKAFLSQFVASLAVEVRDRGIDVVAVHPSPVATNFYNNTHKLDMLDMVCILFNCIMSACIHVYG